MSNFVPGFVGTGPNAALERVTRQIQIAEAVIAEVLLGRGYVATADFPHHVSDIVAELVTIDPTFLGNLDAAEDRLAVANAGLAKLPKNALHPGDSYKHVARFVGREACPDRESSDAHIQYIGPTEARRETRKLADMLAIDLFAIEARAIEIGEREAADRIERDRIAEQQRLERVRAKSRSTTDPEAPHRKRAGIRLAYSHQR